MFLRASMIAALSGDLDCEGAIETASTLSFELAANDSLCNFSRINSESSMIAVTVFSFPLSTFERISGSVSSFVKSVERSVTLKNIYFIELTLKNKVKVNL